MGQIPSNQSKATLLVHGLGANESELGSLSRVIRQPGHDVFGLTLAGHGLAPMALCNVLAEDWINAVDHEFQKLSLRYDTVNLIGSSMGALIAFEVAKRQQFCRGSLVLLAPPVFLDGWAMPRLCPLRHVLYRIPQLRNSVKVYEAEPFGVKNERIRAVLRKRIARNDSNHYSWVPLAAIQQLDRLGRMARHNLHRVRCNTLLVHSREDEMTSIRSSRYIAERLGNARTEFLQLTDSYHLVTIDNERDAVLSRVRSFIDHGPCVADAPEFHPAPRSGPAGIHQLATA